MIKISPDKEAFPYVYNDGCYPQVRKGLTIRQEFAARAMQGYISRDLGSEFSPTEIAHMSVMAADALIVELNKSTQ